MVLEKPAHVRDHGFERCGQCAGIMMTSIATAMTGSERGDVRSWILLRDYLTSFDCSTVFAYPTSSILQDWERCVVSLNI